MAFIIQLFLFVLWTGLIQGQQHFVSQNNIIQLLQQLPETSNLISLLNPDIQTYLTKEQNITFFAPNNNALLSLNENNTTFNSWYHTLPSYHLDWNNTSFELTKQNRLLVKLSCEKQQKFVESGIMFYANVLRSIQIHHQHSAVHIIDKILTVPVGINTTLIKLGLTKSNGMFKLIHSSLNHQLTLFVPNNQAFGTVDPTTFDDDLLSKSHVTEGLITSDLWKDNMVLSSLNGFNMTLNKESKKDWQVSESLQFPAKILYKDVLFENGVMHIINQVLWANNWDRTTKSLSNASQTKLNQPIICLITLIIFFCHDFF